MAFAAPRVILRGGRDDLTPIFWSWQRTKNGRCLLRELLKSENGHMRYPTLKRSEKCHRKFISIYAAFSH
jgi:hypothetical protein